MKMVMLLFLERTTLLNSHFFDYYTVALDCRSSQSNNLPLPTLGDLSTPNATSRSTLTSLLSTFGQSTVTMSSFIEVFGCDMVAFAVFIDGGEVILAIILAWVLSFSKSSSVSDLSRCRRTYHSR